MQKFLRRKPQTVREVLEELGMSPGEIADAQAAGTDELLAIDAVVVPERNRYTIDELAARVGADVDTVRAFWRALGFVDVAPGEAAFSKRDAKILRSLIALTGDDQAGYDVSIQVGRVIGMSMAQVAAAIVDASEARAEERREDVPDAETDAAARDDSRSLAVRAGEVLPFMSEVIDYAFRRHLRAATRRRVALAATVDGAGQVVGFADLVRFTELSRRVDDRELAELVGVFNETVNDVVVRHGGRIVKMIGDAAMFTVVDPLRAGLVALELADAVEADSRLGGLRIGMASGPVLAREGDLYGSVVNLASRLALVGRAGAVTVSKEVRDGLAGDDRFRLRSLGERNLRHIGVARIYRLRPGPGWGETPEEPPENPAAPS